MNLTKKFVPAVLGIFLSLKIRITTSFWKISNAFIEIKKVF